MNHCVVRLWEECANSHLPGAICVAVASKDQRNPADVPVSGEQRGRCGGRNLLSL